MDVLGYPRTWPTPCFIAGGCGAQVFAHTNGDGDFVLFDTLGPPWPVHGCYENRFGLTVLPDSPTPSKIVEEYQECSRKLKAPPTPHAKDIVRRKPEEWLHRGTLTVSGCVQDIVENQLAKVLKRCGTAAEQLAMKAVGLRNTQVTVVDKDLNSYTAFVDLRSIAIVRGTLLSMKLRAVEVIGFREPVVFVCDSLDLAIKRYPRPKYHPRR